MIRVIWRGTAVRTAIRTAAIAAVRDAAEVLRDESDKRVPLDTGVLRNSAAITVDPDTTTAYVSYDTPYARRQHEDLTLRHPNGREAKYLENALNRNRDRLIRYVRAAVQRALRGRNAAD